MKKIIFGLLTMGLMFTSCGEDEPACTANDYVGTYTGTVNCPGEQAASATVFITKISDSQVSFTDNDGFVLLLDVNVCEAKTTIIEDGDSFTVTINLEGNSFSYVISGIVDGDTSTCTGNFSK